MPVRSLNKEEKEAIYVALSLRRNIIETGDYDLSAADVQNIGAVAIKKEYDAEIKALGTSQLKLILLTEKLVTAALQDRSMIIEE